MIDPTWKRKYWELIARHEILVQKRGDGEFDADEWCGLMLELKANGMYSLAEDVKKELEQSTINI